MVKQLNKYLFAIKVGLPNSPLRDINCYVIRSKDRNLLIDTGFNLPECLSDLKQGIAELGLDMAKTDILATHFHADHCGLVDKVIHPQSRFYMGAVDKALLEMNQTSNKNWQRSLDLYTQEGLPTLGFDKIIEKNPAKKFVSEKPVSVTSLENNQILQVGDIALQCIHTPGHTPGHLCLYNAKDKFMILGDHVLFDISPNITTWQTLRNALKSYLESLRMIDQYDVELPLPAHRGGEMTMSERIDQLISHHEERLAETRTIVKENPGISGYDVAGKMHWSIRAKSWEDFPIVQKWFAMGEALAHLYYLEEAGSLRRELYNNTTAYFLE